MATLDGASKYYGSQFLRDAGRFDAAWVIGQFHRFDFKDEFDALAAATRDQLGRARAADFDAALAKLPARKESTFEKLLADKLAIDADGKHIAGRIGKVQVGMRPIGLREIEVESADSIKYRKRLARAGVKPGPAREVIVRPAMLYWPIYAGEGEERIAGGGAPDPLPPGTPGLPLGALNTRISNECAVLACDSIVDNLDEGTGAAVIQGRSGAQPADPDTAATGTLGFTLVCSATAFGGAADDTGKATATASAVTDDTSADATITLGYCRASSTNDGATPLDDHIDGEAGTSGADFNFNTLSIVSGATISLSAWTLSMPES